MIFRVLGLLAGNLAVLLGARVWLSHARTGLGHVDALLFVLFRLTLISGVILVSGLAGMLFTPFLGVAGFAVILLLLSIPKWRALATERVPLPAVGVALWLVAGVLAARLFAQIWIFSPHLGDATNYYLPKIAEWIRAGRFTREMGAHPHVTFPAGFELVETWWVVFLHHDVLIEMAGAEFLFLGAAATNALARSLGVGPRSAFLAAILFALTPGISVAATSCINDVPAAAAVVTAFALVSCRVPLGWTVLALGLGIGIKPTVGYAAPGIALYFWLSRKEPALQDDRRLPARIAAAAGLLLGGFWYARNWTWYGNPFYPVGSRDPALFPPPQFGPKGASLLGNLGDLLNSKLYDPHAYAALVDDSAGWGPVSVGCGLLALLLWVREAPRARALAASFGLSLCSVLLFSIRDPWCMKYVFFFPAILSVAAAREVERSPAILPIVAAGMVFEFVAASIPFDLPAKQIACLTHQSWKDRSILEPETASMLGPTVGVFGAIEGRAYLLYGPDYSRQVVYFRVANAAELERELLKEGVGVLLADPATEDQVDILKDAVRQGHLTRLNGWFYRVASFGGVTQ